MAADQQSALNDDAGQAPARDTSFTSWKLDLLETVNADPQCDGACLKVVEAYLHFARRDTHRAWLSILDLQTRTALSQPTISKARQKLADLGYLVADGFSASGATAFVITNRRREIVSDHMLVAKETLREREANRKATKRERLANKPSRVNEPLDPKSEGVQTSFGDGSKEPLDKHLYGTPVGCSLEVSRPHRAKENDPWGIYEETLQSLHPKSTKRDAA